MPPITQVLRDLARGRPLLTCGMAGAGNSASHQWASAPGNCPWQYTYAYETENSIGYSCGFSGVVSIQIDGAPWARTWWSMGGDSVTEFLPAAKARLGNWDIGLDNQHLGGNCTMARLAWRQCLTDDDFGAASLCRADETDACVESVAHKTDGMRNAA